jgi:hypothetical protein
MDRETFAALKEVMDWLGQPDDDPTPSPVYAIDKVEAFIDEWRNDE